MGRGLVVTLAVIGLIVLGVVVWAVGINNSLVRSEQDVNEKWAQVQNVYQRRADLIPNLVETVKGYAAHERQTLEAVIQARNMAINAQGPAQQAQAENMITGALKSLFAVAEAYPQLQAVQEFKDLSSNLTATEDTLQYARRYYNAQVRDYNTAIATFPGLVLAPLMGFTRYQFFEMEAPADRELPKVTFS